MKKYLIVENLYETIANSDGTVDLRFIVGGNIVWVRGSQIPEDIDEFYFDDADNLRKAIEDGRIEY